MLYEGFVNYYSIRLLHDVRSKLIIGTLSLRGDFLFGWFDLKSREKEIPTNHQVLEVKFST